MSVPIMSGTSTQARKQRVSLLFERVITHNELHLADEIFAEDFHWPQFGLHGPEGVRAWVRDFRTAFPDVLDTVQEQVAEGDVVITRVRVTGTQLGGFRGLPPSGRRADFMAVGIDRFRGEKVIERTALFDFVDLMKQLGHASYTIPRES
jgi:predicted ester cyclase